MSSCKSFRAGHALVFLVLAALPLAGGPLVAQEALPGEGPSIAESLRQDLERQFRILRLRNGVVLEPLTDLEGVQVIEIVGGTFAIDGQAVERDELEERLGEEAAAAVVAVGEMGEQELESLFEALDAGAMEVSVTEKPEAEPDAERARPRRPPRPRRPLRHDDPRVVFGSDLTVERDEVAQDVVVFGGTLRVEGEVTGDAAVIGGVARIEGRIDGDLAVVGGQAYLEDGAEVMGQVVTVGAKVAELSDDAVVHGEIIEVPFGPSFSFNFWPRAMSGSWERHRPWPGYNPMARALDFVWEVFGLVILVLLACLAFLLARGPVERIGRRVGSEPWKAGLVGLVAQILFVPLLVLVVLILTISIIGIPLLLLVPFAVLGAIVIAFLGYTAVAFRLGSWAEERFGWSLPSPYLALLLGIGFVQVWSLIGEALDVGGGPLRFFAVLFLLFGGLAKYVTWTVGLGGALLTRFGTSASWGGAAALPPPTAPPPLPEEVGEAPAAAEAADERPFWEREEGPDEAEGPEEPEEPEGPEEEPEPSAEEDRPGSG